MHLPLRDCFDHHALYWLSVSSGVRINQQGFTFYDSPVKHSGESYQCPRTLGALCSHGSYAFLRCTNTPLTIAGDAPPPFHKLWGMEGCKGRFPTTDQFDVMPCDLKDGTALIWADNRISVQYSMDVPYWPTLLVCLIVIWLIINMGESIASILRVKGSNGNNGKLTSGLCVVLATTILIYTPLDLWVTDRERWIFIFTLLYIFAYSAYHIVNPHTINIIVGCLVLVTARFYQHNDTPYAAGFLFCIATRFVQKAYVTSFSGEDDMYQYTRIGFMVLDVAFFVLIYTESLQNAFPDSMHGQLCVVGILFAAWVVGKLLSEFITRNAVM